MRSSLTSSLVTVRWWSTDEQKEEGGNSDIRYNIDGPGAHCYARNKAVTNRQRLLKNAAHKKWLEQWKAVRVRGCGWGHAELLFDVSRVWFHTLKSVLETDGADSCAAVWMIPHSTKQEQFWKGERLRCWMLHHVHFTPVELKIKWNNPDHLSQWSFATLSSLNSVKPSYL